MFSERRTLLVFDVEECLEYREGPASSTLRMVGRVVGSRGGIDVCLIIFARFIRSWTTRWTHVNVYNVLVLLAGSLEIYYLYEED